MRQAVICEALRTPVGPSGGVFKDLPATGARILASLLRKRQRHGGRCALKNLCIGGGQGLAAVFERS